MADLALRPYSGAGDKTLPDNVKALPEGAKSIWVAAFNSAWDSWTSDKTDQPQERYAFAVAWAAVKKVYKQVDGEWKKRDRAVAGDGYLTRVWEDQAGVRRWRATSGDDGVDQYATRMTRDFQLDMCARAADHPPWLGISHYGKFGQIGVVDRLYLDGRKLKAEGRWLTDTEDELQAKLVEAAYAAALEERNLLPAHRTIRTSIAFYPEAFEIEDCGVIGYTRGWLEHVALTTRPANSRADFGLEEDDTMPGKRSQTRRELRREDAAAIIGDDLAGRLFEIEGKIGEDRSADEDGLVYRTSGDDIEVSRDKGETWEKVEIVPAAGGDAFIPLSLRQRAEALWAAEQAGDAEPLAVAQAQVRADLEAGSLAKPTLAEAIDTFAGAHDVGSALLRATGIPDFAGALAAIISDPESLAGTTQVGVDTAIMGEPEDREGRRLKGEVLKQFEAAVESLGEVLGWARENLKGDEEPAPKTKRAADDSLSAILEERWGTEPDDTVFGTMNQSALIETVYTAGHALIEIIIANIEADHADLALPARLANVQRALDEFGQIMNQAISRSAEPRSAAGEEGAANGAGVKSGDGDGGTVKSPPDGPAAEASAGIEAILADARAFAESDDRTTDGAQAILDRLGGHFRDLLVPETPEGAPASDVTEIVAAAMAPVLERMDGFQRVIERLVLPAAVPDGEGNEYVPAPPRRATIASPRRGVQPSLLPTGPRRLDASRGMKPGDFARGAHRSAGDPRLGS
jgi:cation transport regulator ChaB